MNQRLFLETFARVVEQQPEKTALRAQDGDGERVELSFRALAERAGRWAQGLRNLPELNGLERTPVEPRVALAFDQRLDLVVGMLAVLEAGATFLPLDLELPAARLAYLLADSEAVLVLTRRHLRSRLPAATPRRVAVEELAVGGPVKRRLPLTPESLAYTIYTSGSTGEPKGVLLTHRGLANLVAADPLGLGPQDVVLQAASPSFDASIFEIFLCLAAGATLELGSVGPPPLGAELLARLRHHHISAAVLTPSVLATLPPEAPALLPELRVLMVAGEPCPAPLVEAWSTGRRLLNGYGPTEATVCATVGLCSAAEGSPPLGRAIPGARVELVDAALQPFSGPGLGELVIAGLGLARGYHHRPASTARSFVPDNLSGESGARLYRSGDLVRRRADGELEFVGRIDGQVKVHGCRVEPGEIEAALVSLVGVSGAAVVVRGGRLVASVVPRGEARPSAEALRQALAERLPPHMVPATFTLLDHLPLTAGGKLDRAALAALHEAAPGFTRRSGGRAPSSGLERQLALLWREVLGCPEVMLDDNFFTLGGHSLHVVQLTSRVAERLGRSLAPRQLFRHPTLERLAAALEDGEAPAAASATGPERLPRSEPLPLTAAQRQLWYLDVLHRSAGAVAADVSYNMMAALRFHNHPPDLGGLRFCLDTIVERHEVLRTRFVLLDGEPRQEITSARPPVATIDVSGLPCSSWERQSSRLTTALLRRPFDLSRDVMLRAALILGREDHRLVLVMHHIASDGWSIGVLLAELSTLYGSRRAHHGSPPPLPPLKLQYADVGHWQDRILSGARRRQLLDYWRRQLEGAPQTLELPTDRPRGTARALDNPGASYEFVLRSTELEDLLALGRAAGATLFMTLLAAWSALIYRWSWQRDLLHSVPFASRLHPASEGLVGFFTNMLVLRIRLADEQGALPSFKTLLASTRETCLDAFAHQDLPFVELVEALRPERQSGRMPFVQSGFALQNAFRADRACAEFELLPATAHTGSSRFELSLSVSEEKGRLAGSFEYRTDLFDPTTLLRLARSFSGLCAAAGRAPETPLDHLSFLSPLERHQLLVELGRNDQWFDLSRSLDQLVGDQIVLRPATESARFEGRSLSYAELGRAAARLVSRLEAAGVEPGSPVGLLLERSLELPVALLAVLAAGGICVPLDPDLPAERLRFLLTDTAARVVVTQPHLLGHLPVDWQGRVLEVEDALDGPPAELLPLPHRRLDMEAVAYIVYTSGSTGLPKGVLMHHRGLTHRMLWQQAAYPLAPGDRVLQNLSIGFDAAIWQLFGPLIAGAAVVLPRPGGHMDAAYLARFLDDERVSCADFVPSVLTSVLEEASTLDKKPWAPSLRQVVSGGEALTRELASRIFSALPAARLLNIYGPTETSLTITTATCSRDGSSPTLPIGRPIANTPTYLLDAHLQPVAAGVVGEIYAAGAGITLGYLRRPSLTAERFLPDPFAATPGGRLYSTGDLARLLPDGALEFLGRADQQVKIRGVRIELGEIEARLRELEGVLDAVVLARTDVPGAAAGEKRLVAYVVAEREAPPTSRLRARLAERLPPAMVPGVFVFLPALPLNVNGKVDRKSLPAPDTSGEDRSSLLVPPRDHLEAELVEIWSQALGLDEVSVTDHFFDLGGHSLLAVKLLSEVKRRLGTALELAELVAAGTLEEMANRVRARRSVQFLPTARPGSLVAFSAGRCQAGDHVLVFVHAVDGSVFGYAPLARRLSKVAVVYGLEAPGLEGETPLAATLLEDFEALANHHAEVLLASLPPGPLVLCGWSAGGLLASAITCRLEELGRAPERLILLDTHPSPPAEAAVVESLTDGLPRLHAGLGEVAISRRRQVFRCLMAASASYRSRPHGCPTTLIQAGSMYTSGAPAPWLERQVEHCRRLTLASFEVESVDTDHHGLLSGAAGARVAERLMKRLGVEVGTHVAG